VASHIETMRIGSSLRPRVQLLVLVITVAFGTETGTRAQAPQQIANPEVVAALDADRPLPDITALMREVGVHQKAAEDIRKDYLYHAAETRQENDGNGAVKKTISNEYDVFWVNGVSVQRLTRKNGKELTVDEQKKESERIDKDIAKAQEKKSKADTQGKDTDSRGNGMLTASRILELGAFTNPRRVKLDGRDTIVVDYAGNPKAKTWDRFEDVVKDLVGTVWVDEQDKMLTRGEGHFLNAFKIGAGLVVNVRKDTSFRWEQKKINGEVWLPARIEGSGAFRFLLVESFNGKLSVQMSDYRKFKATSTILPGISAVEDGSATSPQ
jgi:hypothetical protein